MLKMGETVAQNLAGVCNVPVFWVIAMKDFVVHTDRDMVCQVTEMCTQFLTSGIPLVICTYPVCIQLSRMF